MVAQSAEQFELIFEGPGDSSPDTLRKLRAAFIAELEFSIDETIKALGAFPVTLKRADSAAGLDRFHAALQRAGAKVLVVQIKDPPAEATPTPQSAPDPLLALELWEPEPVTDAANPAAQPPTPHAETALTAPAATLSFETETMILELPEEIATSPSPITIGPIARVEDSAKGHARPSIPVTFDYLPQHGAPISPAAVSAPILPATKAHVTSAVEVATAPLTPSASTTIPLPLPDADAPPLFIVYPDPPSRLWWLSRDVVIGIASGVLVLAIFNWWILSHPAQPTLAAAPITIPFPRPESEPALSQKTSAVAEAPAPQSWKAESSLAAAPTSFQAISQGSTLKTLTLTIQPPAPAPLTKAEIAQGKTVPGWVTRIEIDGLQINSSPAGDFVGSGPARLSIAHLGTMHRQVITASVTGTWSASTRSLHLRLQSGNATDHTNWLGPVSLMELTGGGFSAALLAEQSLVMQLDTQSERSVAP